MTAQQKEAIARREVIRAEEAAILANPTEVKKCIQRLIKGKASRRYKEISDAMGIDIVWGSGGAQTARVAKLTASGIPFIRVA